MTSAPEQLISGQTTPSNLRDPQEGEETVEGEGDTGDGASVDASGESAAKRAPTGAFNSESARKAAQARWEKQRQREADSEVALREAVDDRDSRLVLVPVGVGLVIRRLDTDARKGSTQAARELRSWLSEYPPQDDSFDPSSLDRATRARLYAIALARIDELEQAATEDVPANEDIREGTGDVLDDRPVPIGEPEATPST